MPLDFPPSPAVNEIYPFGGRYWIWNGTAWDSYNPSASNVVTQLNGLTGGVTLAAGSNITLTPSGNTITIESSGGGGISGPYVISFNGLTGAVTGVSSVRGLTGTVGISAGLGITLSTSGQTLTISNLVTNEDASVSTHYLAFYGVTSGVGNPKVDSGLRYVPFQNNILGDGGLILRGLSAGGVANQNTLVLNDPNNDGIVFYTADNNILVSNFSGAFGDITSLSLVSWDFLDNPRTATIEPIATYTGNQTFTLPDDSGTIALTKNVVSSFNGLTGAVTGVRSIRGLTGAVGITNGSGIGLSVSGQTMTFSNTGVLSIDGSTGAITNVARTNVNNNFSANQTISLPFGQLTVVNTILGVTANYSANNIQYYSGSNSQTITSSPSNPSNNITLPNFSTTLAGLSGTQTFTGTNTFNTLTNFPGGISAAGATFSSLVRFNAGISAAGGTFGNAISVNGNITTTGSINASGGATFQQSIKTTDIVERIDFGLLNGGLYLNNKALSYTSIGTQGKGNFTYLAVDDNNIQIIIQNGYGGIYLGDADANDTGNYIYYDAQLGSLSANNSLIEGFNTISSNNGFYETANSIRVTNNARSWFL